MFTQTRQLSIKLGQEHTGNLDIDCDRSEKRALEAVTNFHMITVSLDVGISYFQMIFQT